MGKNVVAIKMQALVVGGVIGSLAGVMFAIRATAANAESYGATVTFFAYTVLILGGAASRFEVTDRPHRALCADCPARERLCSYPIELTMRDSPEVVAA